MKPTYEELEQRIEDLERLIEKMRDQLTGALDQVASDHKAKGEWHHRAFEKICPAPDLDSLSLVKNIPEYGFH